MLHWSKPCNETKLSLGSRIPVSQGKRNRSFRMNEKKEQASRRRDSSARNIHKRGYAFEIVRTEKGSVSTKYKLEPQRNIEADVFDWLSKNCETLDKYTEYCLENNTNVCDNTEERHQITNGETASKTNKKNFRSDLEDEREMAKDRTGTKSYFNAFRNAIFPFEGKYFYLSGERNNQKVSLTETTKTIGEISGGEKKSCEDDKYKEILGDKKAENEAKMSNKRWEINGLKDTKVYHEDQRVNTEDKNGYLKYQHECNNMPLKIHLKPDSSADLQQKEMNRLRTQIEKLSSFVESSEERREESEKLLVQQKEELLKHIREKELLDNRVCCLEELRRNLQRKCDEISEDNKSLKLALKSNEEKFAEEKERVKVLKKECSNEVAKNAELELVLHTIREELGCPSACNYQKSSRDDSKKDWGEKFEESDRHAQRVEKKVHWGDVQTQEITKPTQSLPFNAEQQLWGPGTKLPQPESDASSTRPHYSCLKQNTSDEGLWRREKKQFEGKIMLLEMDKKKLRSQIELLEAKIIKQENTEKNLRENNEVLEFRILELEYELLEKARKK